MKIDSTENKDLQIAFEKVITAYTEHNPNGDFDLINRAYRFAKDAHEGMSRRSGEPYIIHPLSVALIATKEIGLGATSIAASFLHDVVEDTEYTIEDLEVRFGSRVAKIVEGLTKLHGKELNTKELKEELDPKELEKKSHSPQSENFRRLLLTMSEDIRVILIKIADRLHNMRTLSSMPPNKQYKISGETLFMYAPLAHRLGLFAIKTELEDLSFKYEHPSSYKELEKKVEITTKDRDRTFDIFISPIEEKLAQLGMKFTIQKRLKSIYSIWKKMKSKNIPFEEVYDLMAIRIVFTPRNLQEERSQCWEIYNAIAEIYKTQDSRHRNWINNPKSNGYEALHITVMGNLGRFVEVQIRSKRMDEIAEKGYAAHWKYKGEIDKVNEMDKWIQSIREQLERPESNSIEFMDNIKLNFFTTEILVFTPKGEMKTLPWGSSVLDFAFEIHTDLAIHCIGAKINHKLVSSFYTLQGGDQIEILTSEKQAPEAHWIHFVRTGKAKNRLNNYFFKQSELYVKQGREMLEKALSEIKIQNTPEISEKIAKYYNVKEINDLFVGFANNKYSLELKLLPQIIKDKTDSRLLRYWNSVGKRFSSSKAREAGKVKYIVANCCNPIPGDDIIGLDDVKQTEIIIHKRQCPIAIKLMAEHGDKIVEASWGSHQQVSFLTTIKIIGIDRVGLVSEVTKVISENYTVNMRSIHFDSKDGIFEGVIQLYVQHDKNVNLLTSKILKIEGVKSAVRIENFIL